jgi:hypothetical protein
MFRVVSSLFFQASNLSSSSFALYHSLCVCFSYLRCLSMLNNNHRVVKIFFFLRAPLTTFYSKQSVSSKHLHTTHLGATLKIILCCFVLCVVRVKQKITTTKNEDKKNLCRCLRCDVDAIECMLGLF